MNDSVQFPMTLDDLEGHSPVAEHITPYRPTWSLVKTSLSCTVSEISVILQRTYTVTVYGLEKFFIIHIAFHLIL